MLLALRPGLLVLAPVPGAVKQRSCSEKKLDTPAASCFIDSELCVAVNSKSRGEISFHFHKLLNKLCETLVSCMWSRSVLHFLLILFTWIDFFVCCSTYIVSRLVHSISDKAFFHDYYLWKPLVSRWPESISNSVQSSCIHTVIQKHVHLKWVEAKIRVRLFVLVIPALQRTKGIRRAKS